MTDRNLTNIACIIIEKLGSIDENIKIQNMKIDRIISKLDDIKEIEKHNDRWMEKLINDWNRE